MAIVKQRELQELLTQGVERAQNVSKTVLVSQLTRVLPADPLSFFGCGEKDRFFWADPERTTLVAGSGIARRLTAKGGERFENIEQQRSTLLEDSVMDVNASIPVTGPVFLGGFAFDPSKKKTGLWSSFPDAELVLPKYMLTVVNEESWLTTNYLVTFDSDPIREAELLLEEQNQLLMNSRNTVFENEPGSAYSVKEIAPRQWMDAVGEAAREIRDELFEKVVLTRELQLTSEQNFNPVGALRRLYEQQPNSFLFAVGRGESCFLGASPERLVRRKGIQLISACLASSTERGETLEEDEKFGNWLLHDRKNRHEHEVVVDMIRGAMAQVCSFVDVPDDPVLYKMKDIQHLYTPVVGRAPGNSSLLKVAGQLHPTPALGGFPRDKALKRIREVEPHNRGWYGAPVGWIDYKGDGEFAVAIRSGLLQGNKASLIAGNGIVGDSDPESEYRETQMKFRPMLSALGGDR